MIPTDTFILLSYINTLLRDQYSCLEALCEDLELSEEEVIKKLCSIGKEYNREANRFV